MRCIMNPLNLRKWPTGLSYITNHFMNSVIKYWFPISKMFEILQDLKTIVCKFCYLEDVFNMVQSHVKYNRISVSTSGGMCLPSSFYFSPFHFAHRYHTIEAHCWPCKMKNSQLFHLYSAFWHPILKWRTFCFHFVTKCSLSNFFKSRISLKSIFFYFFKFFS